MNKRKILSLAMVLSIVAIMAVGATLAYFTDTDSAKNTFTVGNIDIAVTENGEDTEGLTFEDVMPGQNITKTAVVSNDSSEAAYVRVVVHLNKQYGLYSMLLDESGDNLAVDMAQVMPGWKFNPEKANKANDSGMRYLWDETDTTDVDVIAIDVAMANQQSGKYLADEGNFIINDDEKAAAVDGRVQMAHRENCTYFPILGWDDLAWVFYLKMDPTSSYTLFEGINPAASFTEDEMKFFDGLEISVCADAIQSTGFTTDKAAFEELEKAHPLSAWNLK